MNNSRSRTSCNVLALLFRADDFGDEFGLTVEQLLEIQSEADVGKLNDKGGVSLIQG